jgi:predicted membrane channel-forming protein YqfA (hemolysin III family)
MPQKAQSSRRGADGSGLAGGRGRSALPWSRGLYTVVGFHLIERMRYHNAHWRLFVLSAAGCHFCAVAVEFVM